MTDVTPPDGAPRPEELAPEELASSYLDGELAVDERALVEADPALLARVEEHRAVRDALAVPVAALAPGRRDEMLAAALAAAGDSPTGAPVVALDRRRTARHWMAAAGAVAAAAVVALVLVVARSGGDDTQTARDASEESAIAASATTTPDEAGGRGGTAADDTGEDADTASPEAAGSGPGTESTLAAAAAPAPAEDAARSAATNAAALVDLGPIENRQAFIDAARRFATTAPAAGQGPCPEYPPPLATATFQGTPAYLVVIEATSVGNRVALVAIDACASLVKADYAEE